MSANIINLHVKAVQQMQVYTDLSVTQLMRENGIQAVLWKGRELDAATDKTDGDIDLLVSTNDKQRAENLLRKHGFRYVANAKWRNQPRVSDWYRVHNAKLVHLQLYDQLILGSYASEQILVPNSTYLFESKNAYAADSASAVLRICRATLCSSFHPGRTVSEFIDEARQLEHSVENITQAASNLFDDAIAKDIASAYKTGNVHHLKKQLHQRYVAPQPAGGSGITAHILKFVSNLNRRTMHLPLLARRSLKNPAPIVALIGSDGSGKSTAAAKSAKRINTKIDTKFIYFGTGDGASSLLRLPLIFLKRVRENKQIKKNNLATAASRKVENAPQDKVPGFAKAAWAISVALERKSKMKRARKYAAAGIIVITDRYPQNEEPGIHDGPRLSAWLSREHTNKSSLKCKLANWEKSVYEQLSRQQPSLVVLLDVDLETASVRRPDEPQEELQRRISVARALRYGDADKVVINAAEPLDVVLGKTMQAILEAATIEV